MVKSLLLVICVVLSVSFLVMGCKSGDVPANAIMLVAKLPDTDQYKINGMYVDIGIAYRNCTPLTPCDKQWCLFNGKTYWKYEKTQLDVIAKQAGITLPTNMDFPFWHSTGGRVVIFLITIAVIVPLVILWEKIKNALGWS